MHGLIRQDTGKRLDLPPVILSAAKNPHVADERFFAALRMTGGGRGESMAARGKPTRDSSLRSEGQGAKDDKEAQDDRGWDEFLIIAK